MVHIRKEMNWQGSAEHLEGHLPALRLEEPEILAVGQCLWTSWLQQTAPQGPQGVTAVKAQTGPQIRASASS